MKDGAICCNAGHFDVEVDVAGLRKIAASVFEARKNIEGFRLADGRTIYILGEGKLVNLACGDGHPAEIMDMSFAIQALSAAYLVAHKDELKNADRKVIPVPREVDLAVASRRLAFWGIEIDCLSAEQQQYMGM